MKLIFSAQTRTPLTCEDPAAWCSWRREAKIIGERPGISFSKFTGGPGPEVVRTVQRILRHVFVSN